MRYLRGICRFAVGMVFILSGFLKAIDPVGNSLKIDEYLKAFHLGFFDFLSMPAGFILSCAEFLIGVAILKGIKMKWFTKAALWFISFFTLLTLYSALFSPVEDCGCFGEAIHLSNWGTFLKNLLLLGSTLLIFYQRDKFKPIASPYWEKIYLGCYTALITGISLYALIFLPQIDFGNFKAGTDVASSLGEAPEMEYKAKFIYAKDGVEREFTMENMPDSTWEFVDTVTELVAVDDKASATADFILKDSLGNYVTREILAGESPLFFVSIYNSKKIGKEGATRISELQEQLYKRDAKLYIVSGNSPEETESMIAANNLAITPLYTDYKSSISINRSNGGVTYLDNGTIIAKWSRWNYPKDVEKLLGEDPEIVTANGIIDEQLFMEISLFIILFMIMIVRFISKIILRRVAKKGEKESETPETECETAETE